MSGRLRVNRRVMAQMAPDADPALLDATDQLAAPLRAALAKVDLAALDTHDPAVAFRPAAARHALPSVHPLPPAPVPATPSSRDDVPWLPAADVAALVRTRRLDPAEVVAAYADRIERLQPILNAFLTVTLSSPGRLPACGRLAGVPVGLKDMIDTAGVPTTCGSRLFTGRVPSRDARVWQRLRRAGAILGGKLNTQEFAAGVTSDNDTFGPVRNPWDTSRIAGGSSGGSAAAVATALVAVGVGTDTGGSVRVPAACCGVVGIKPTFGLLPMTGVYPLSWSLDHVGVLARTVRDAALTLATAGVPRCELAARSGAVRGPGTLRIGVPRAWLAGIEPAVARCFETALTTLEGAGARLVEVELPDPDLLVAINRVIAYAEGSAQHERFLCGEAPYGAAVRPRLEAGRYVLAGDYLTAQRLRAAAVETFTAVSAGVDVLATPSLPCTAPALGDTEVDLGGGREPVGTALVRFTAPFNLTGMPAVSLPCGYGDVGLPAGLQLVAPAGQDALLCFAAAAYEAIAPGTQRPPVSASAAAVRRGVYA
ncbi:amidase [Amycolatopsis sp. K13G38]|uniref:Amidase n=1 Tax=Amycolatopsis acididurans TaxID=2724524 RepID=A0ABX1IYS2_9PSEU|nr:amidase [Amycolatopsis acididurans]NKQ52301.1 amidase [Amycolatopsis acididurans]